jgi:hypothetical protein
MPVIQGKYYTEEEVAAIKNQSSSSDFDSFLLSGDMLEVMMMVGSKGGIV